MWQLANESFESRLILGTALYPSPDVMRHAIQASGAQVVTVSLRRQAPAAKGGQAFWDIIKSLGVKVLPNTAGCKTVKEAMTIAQMSREVFGSNWIKVEIIGDDYTLQPDTTLTIEAARQLIAEGFEVFPYTTEDLVVAQKLVAAGCRIVMPWGAPIGSGQGILNPFAIKTLRERLPDITLIVDAGLGKPSEAIRAMELGFDGVLLNSAVALSDDPVRMAQAFKLAVAAGRLGREAGFMPTRDFAAPSTPTMGTPFWHQEEAKK